MLYYFLNIHAPTRLLRLSVQLFVGIRNFSTWILRAPDGNFVFLLTFFHSYSYKVHVISLAKTAICKYIDVSYCVVREKAAIHMSISCFSTLLHTVLFTLDVFTCVHFQICIIVKMLCAIESFLFTYIKRSCSKVIN